MLGTVKIWKLIAAVAVALGLSGAALAATGAAAHDHGGHQVKLALDNGKKWATDEPLRKGMASIRASVEGSLHEIHEGKLDAAGYNALADKVGAQVGGIVAECKLEPKADAQLHVVIAQMLEGVEAMQGKQKKVKRQAGAVKVLTALEQYGNYFDDPNWKAIQH